MKTSFNQTRTNQFPKDKVLKIIDSAKEFEKGKRIDTLSQIVNNYSKNGYPTNPGELPEEINSTGETAYQRAIFSSEKTKFNTMGEVVEVVWNDLELPVVFNERSRRRCVDLVGTLNNNTSVLCELKFASEKYSSNSPIYAAIELMVYYYLIQDNCEELDEGEVFHKNRHGEFKWCNFRFDSILIVGANKTYWDYWQTRYEKQKNEIESWFKKLNSLLTIRFFSSPDFDFKEQKKTKGGGKYKPSVSGKSEWTEIYL